MFLFSSSSVELYNDKVIGFTFIKCSFSRHSTMLVGQTGSGKSVCWKILQAAMTRLKRDGDSNFNIVRVSLPYVSLYMLEPLCNEDSVVMNDIFFSPITVINGIFFRP